MRIVIKTGGVIVLGVALLGLSYAVIATFHRGGESTNQTFTPPAVGGASVISAPLISGNNLLKNGDFEADFVASHPDFTPPVGHISGQNGVNWQDNSAWGDIAVSYAPEKSNPHGGKACQKIVIAHKKGGQAQFTQVVKATVGKQLHASVWVRTASTLPVLLELRDPKDVHLMYGTTTATIGPEWQQIEVTGKATQSSDVMFMLIEQQPGTIWADDASVAEVL